MRWQPMSSHLRAKLDKIGTYKLPVSVTSGFRTVNDTMTIVVNNVDDKATIVNSIPDQLLPEGTRLAVSIEEIFEDIDNDLDYTQFVLSTSNATALKIQKLNTNGDVFRFKLSTYFGSRREYFIYTGCWFSG